jgi:hypothetical protein
MSHYNDDLIRKMFSEMDEARKSPRGKHSPSSRKSNSNSNTSNSNNNNSQSSNNNTNYRQGFNVLNRSTIVKIRDRYTGFYKFLESEDERVQGTTRFAIYIPAMLVIYKQVLTKQKRVKEFDIAAAAILDWVKPNQIIHEDFIFGIDKDRLRFKRKFQAKLYALWNQGKIPRKQMALSPEVENHIREIKTILGKDMKNEISDEKVMFILKHITWLGELYQRFVKDNHSWLKKIVGGPKPKMVAFLYSVFVYMLANVKKPEKGQISFISYDATKLKIADKKAVYCIQEYAIHAKPMDWMS